MLVLQRVAARQCYCHVKRRIFVIKETGDSQLFQFSRPFSRNFVDIIEDKPILVREFVHSALYNPKFGYFATRPDAVGVLPEPLSFDSLKGRGAYRQLLDSLYKQNDVGWFTPVEIFKPWYGYAIGEYILQSYNPAFPLQIYEIGGGAGTCARNILDYIKSRASSIYKDMSYVSVEISEALAMKQIELVNEVKSHRKRFHVEYRSAVIRNGWGPSDKHPCFVIMLEVLDNLPHDLIYRESPASPWMETYVFKDQYESCPTRCKELYKPLQDPNVQLCLSIIESEQDYKNFVLKWFSTVKKILLKYWPIPRKVWIPTGCLQLLQTLYDARPNMYLIASDFSTLPDVKVEGERAPLVATKRNGFTQDYSTYLDATGDADIFFPTDFTLLERLDNHCSSMVCFRADGGSKIRDHAKRHSSIMAPAQFMRHFADISKTKTKDGYNPLLDDYGNTKFYLSTPI